MKKKRLNRTFNHLAITTAIINSAQKYQQMPKLNRKSLMKNSMFTDSPKSLQIKILTDYKYKFEKYLLISKGKRITL